MARRLGELPETRPAFAVGELAEDQVAVIVRPAPAATDAEVAARRRGHWRLSALLPRDEGALWERALAAAREDLFRSPPAPTSPTRAGAGGRGPTPGADAGDLRPPHRRARLDSRWVYFNEVVSRS